MVRQRVFYGSILLIGLVVLMIADAWLSRPAQGAQCPLRAVLGFGGLTAFGFALVVLGGAVELCRICRQAGYQPALAWSLLMVVLFMVAPWLSSPHGWVALSQAGTRFTALSQIEGILPWIALLGTALILVARQRTNGAIGAFGTGLLVVFYLGGLSSYCVRLRCWWPGPEGAWLTLAILFIIKVTDIGAYFTGIALGKTPLIPRVSPKKTWEGLIGGVAAAAAVSYAAMGWLLPVYGGCAALRVLSIPQVIVFGIVMAVIGQAGDLVESLFKRDGGVKDSAHLVPTFGGVLDVIDSPILAVPVAYWLLRWWLSCFPS